MPFLTGSDLRRLNNLGQSPLITGSMNDFHTVLIRNGEVWTAGDNTSFAAREQRFLFNCRIVKEGFQRLRTPEAIRLARSSKYGTALISYSGKLYLLGTFRSIVYSKVTQIPLPFELFDCQLLWAEDFLPLLSTTGQVWKYYYKTANQVYLARNVRSMAFNAGGALLITEDGGFTNKLLPSGLTHRFRRIYADYSNPSRLLLVTDRGQLLSFYGALPLTKSITCTDSYKVVRGQFGIVFLLLPSSLQNLIGDVSTHISVMKEGEIYVEGDNRYGRLGLAKCLDLLPKTRIFLE